MADKPRFELSATQVIGGGLAAAGAAVAASMLGVYGTVIGSAVMSVVATVGTALYSHSVQRGKQTFDRVKQTRVTGKTARIETAATEQPTAATSVDEDAAATDGQAGPQTAAEDTVPEDATNGALGQTVGEPQREGGDEPASPSWRERLRALNWRAVSVTAALVLVVGLGIVTVAELAMGQNMTSALRGGDGEGAHRPSVVRAFNAGAHETTRKHGPAGGSDSSPASTPTVTETDRPGGQRTTSQEPRATRAPSSEPTSEPTTTEPTTAPTTAPETTDDSDVGDTSVRVPNERATGGDREP